MLAAERKQRIREIILEKKSASVAALAKLFSVTDETIRRDLKCLEKEGVLIRTYGGAFIQSGVENLVDAEIRKNAYKQEKEERSPRSANNSSAMATPSSWTTRPPATTSHAPSQTCT